MIKVVENKSRPAGFGLESSAYEVKAKDDLMKTLISEKISRFISELFGINVPDGERILSGLHVVLGGAGTGKTTLMSNMFKVMTEANGPQGSMQDEDAIFYFAGEPEYIGFLDYPHLVKDCVAGNNIICVDSLRDLLLEKGSGATLPGGVPAEYLVTLAELNAVCRTSGCYALINLNPLLSDSAALRSSVTAMCAGFIDLDAKTYSLRTAVVNKKGEDSLQFKRYSMPISGIINSFSGDNAGIKLVQNY